jgi:hypothetical protein
MYIGLSHRRRAKALINQLIRKLAQNQPILLEENNNRMAYIYSIYSFNRSQTRQFIN